MRAELQSAVELRPRGAAAVVRPRGDRARGRRAPLVLRARRSRGGRVGLRVSADASRGPRRHRRPVRRGAAAELPARAAPESEAAFDLGRRGGRRHRRRRIAARCRGCRTGDAEGCGGASAPPELESALEEAEFFASRGLFDDARTILEEQLARLPKHPLLRRAPRRARRAGARRAKRLRHAPVAGCAAASVEDRSFDIAASLDALDGRPRQRRRAGSGVRRARRPGRRRRGLRQVQGGRRQADRRGRRAEPLRPRRRLQGDGPRRRRRARVRHRRARPASARASATR